MTKKSGFTTLESIMVIIALSFFTAWSVNAYKLAKCDFKSDYKCEAVHAIGLFAPPASFVTVWFDSDK